MKTPSSRRSALRKFVRFSFIYGPGRALTKAAGRLRIRLPRLPGFGGGPGVGIIGCGQFAFSTIAYFLRGKARLVSCFDVAPPAAESFAREYRVDHVAGSAGDLVANAEVGTVFIASNHASHSQYAAAALAAGKGVYVEKPVAVDFAGLAGLCRAVREHPGPVFAGYNRPFSGAVRDLREHLPAPQGPLTLSCFVSGHRIPPDHWYRDPREGTRICGNVGHWLDLAVHMLHWRDLPDAWKITLAWSNPDARDDDMAITLASASGDLVNIVLTARTEPFEGINETINLQWGDLIAKIDDFRRMTVWEGERVGVRRYWPKDVGHRRAVRQPFDPRPARDWREVELSSLLMLRIADMVVRGEKEAEFSFSAEWEALGVA